MPVLSIDQLNARAAHKPASAGKNYARHDRVANPADARAKLAGMDAIELLRTRLAVFFADQRAIVAEFRNMLASGNDATIPF